MKLLDKCVDFVNNVRVNAYIKRRSKGIRQLEAIPGGWDPDVMAHFVQKQLEEALPYVGCFTLGRGVVNTRNMDRPGKLLWVLGDLSPLLSSSARASLLAVATRLESHDWGAVRRPATEARKKLEA